MSFAANDTTRAQINNIPSKSHVISLLSVSLSHKLETYFAYDRFEVDASIGYVKGIVRDF